jgi:hypothetical protein
MEEDPVGGDLDRLVGLEVAERLLEDDLAPAGQQQRHARSGLVGDDISEDGPQCCEVGLPEAVCGGLAGLEHRGRFRVGCLDLLLRLAGVLSVAGATPATRAAATTAGPTAQRSTR